VTALHKKGYDFLIAEQARILHTVIEAIFDKYPVWQEEYGYEGKEKEILMPDIDNKNELNQLIYPIKIFIMDVEKMDSHTLEYSLTVSGIKSMELV